jgi:hypothetical protein
MKKVLVLLALVTLFACARKEEKNYNSTTIAETETPSRIKVIEGSAGWTYYQIIEVDGHQYLANGNHGGFIHLESCPCKTKSYGN